MRTDAVTAVERTGEQGAERQFELRVLYPNRAYAVREALASTTNALAGFGLSCRDIVNVELVLAETLNNISEHAYEDDRRGMVEVQISHRDDCLTCVVIDDGVPMPGGALPEGRLPEIEAAPEGGFGWFMIRSLTKAQHYERVGDRNRLVLVMLLNHGLTAS